jgi:hypothetical protein
MPVLAERGLICDGRSSDPKRTVDADTMNIGAVELNGTNRDEV